MNNWFKRNSVHFIIVAILLPLLIVSILAVNQLQDVRSHAAQQQTIVIPTVVPAPRTLLTAPYYRLVSSPGLTYTAGDQVPVEIYAHTNGQPTSEARLVIAYDSQILNLDQQGIQNGDLYPVVDVESVTPGKAIFSVFVKEEAGYMPVVLSREQKIVTLYFHVIGKGKTKTNISFVINPTNDETTSLSLFMQDPSNPPKNILQSQEGTMVSIH